MSLATAKTATAPTAPTAPDAPTAVGFAKTDAKRMANDASSLLASYRAALAERGERKTRGTQLVKDLAGAVLGDILRSASLHAVARGTRVPVAVTVKLRGESRDETASVPVVDLLRALSQGGTVIGSGRIAK